MSCLLRVRVHVCAVLRGGRGTIIPGLLRRIPSELRSYAPMGENSTTLGDQVGSPRVVPILRPARDFSLYLFDFTTLYEHGRISFVIGNKQRGLVTRRRSRFRRQHIVCRLAPAKSCLSWPLAHCVNRAHLLVPGTNDDVSVHNDIDFEPEKNSSLLIAEHIV